MNNPTKPSADERGINMKNKVLYSSNSCEWETPQDLFDKLNAIYEFELDVCASKENAKCKKYFTKEDDALSRDWRGHRQIWMNPPYGREIGKWVKKAFETGGVVCLLPARTDTKWFHDYCLKYGQIEFIKGRLRFNNCKENAPFPSMLVRFRK
jgi:phage N-6-adenine-methyltransferase